MPPLKILTALVLTAPVPAHAAEIVGRDDGATIERLAEDVYAIIHADATDEWPHGNTGIVVSDDGVLVIDSAYLPSRAKKDIALLRKVTKKPVRFLMTTHWHFDHNNGASAWREAFPNLVVIAERETDDFVNINSTYWPLRSNAEGSARLQSLAGIEAELKAGKAADGTTIGAERRAALEKAIPQRKAELAELAALEVVTADILFDDSLTLKLGETVVELVDRGNANSPHDTTVYLPKEKILFAGDIIVRSPLPYVIYSWPKQWVTVLAELEATPIKTLVPGHGPTMADHAYTQKLRETFETVLVRVAALVREGRTLDQVKEEIELDDLREGYPLWTDGISNDDWAYTMSALVERAYLGVRGVG